jgi:MarR family transcriptional regulator for hemolysin
MDGRGLITRRRSPDNRRVHLVELTPGGEAAFHRLRAAASRFDRRLRRGLSDDDLALLGHLLHRLESNAGSPAPDATAKGAPG